MTKYIPTFGIEIHAELNTVTKAFSSAKIGFNEKPNTLVKPVDIGYPGSKPTVNKKMVEYAYRLSKVLNMHIEKKIYFDRKSYFYPDLPKGFQITQHYKPIGTNGKFTLIFDDFSKKDITITEIHMEEDTAKQIKIDGGILFDFNRSGIPLIEIVSGHEELSSVHEVLLFVKQIREQLIIMDINDGKMEEGSFRVDVNVSIRPENQKEYGTRTEVKNLNSFTNITKALKSEIERQKSIYENGEKLESSTVRYDENTEKTIPMRRKDSNNDYNFIPEGNITPITLSKDLINEWNEHDDKPIHFIRKTLSKNYQESSIEKILSSKELFDWAWVDTDYKLFNYLKNNNLLQTLKNSINEDKVLYLSFKEKINKKISNIIEFRSQGKINSEESNNLISKIIRKKGNHDISNIKNKEMMSDDNIKEILMKIIEENKEMIENDKENRPEKVERFLMGKVMKNSKGKASPQSSMKIVKEELWKK